MFLLGLRVPKRNQTEGKNCRSPERKCLWIKTGPGELVPAWANLSHHLPFPRGKVGSRDRRAVVQGKARGVEWWPSELGSNVGSWACVGGGGESKNGAFLKQTPGTSGRKVNLTFLEVGIFRLQMKVPCKVLWNSLEEGSWMGINRISAGSGNLEQGVWQAHHKWGVGALGHRWSWLWT